MVRRRAIPLERYSSLAHWSWRLALFALPVLVLAVVLARLERVETYAALGVFGAGLAVAALALIIALAALVAIWNHGYRGLREAIGALLVAVLVVVGPAAVGALALRLPALHDVTTDFVDPPVIVAGAVARTVGANSPTYDGERAATRQRVAYPDLRPLAKEWSADHAFQAARAVVEKRGWRLLDLVPPRPGRDGRIEAMVRTLPFGFRDDVVVRVRATPDGARVDVRSASRVGEHDLGTNARRVRALLDDIDEWEPPATKAGPPAPPAATPQRRTR